MSSAPTFEAPSVDQLAALFPGYQIHGLIACGGMGAVYHAVQTSLDRAVAIKILPREFGSDASFRANFQTEAKSMARLNHPNLIGVYDFGEVDGMLYIIMEYVPGESLHHVSYGGRLKGGDAARIVAAICDGLAHAHENGVLHRDIKPANILLDAQARPKIGDFGLARPIGSREGENETVFGTPHYTAPEVLARPDAVDARADIFSVGVLLHQLLTGHVPEAVQGLPSVIAHCDIRFDEIVRKATNPMPEMRYRQAGQMAQELHAIAASLQRPHPAPTSTGAFRPHPTPTGTAAYRPVGNPSRRPVAGRSSTVVVKQSGGGAIKAIVAVVALIGVLYFITKPGGLTLKVVNGPDGKPVQQTETQAPETGHHAMAPIPAPSMLERAQQNNGAPSPSAGSSAAKPPSGPSSVFGTPTK
ncbi:MAG TPA: serine/threonine-protein kinase [Luteolibacter sp.]